MEPTSRIPAVPKTELGKGLCWRTLSAAMLVGYALLVWVHWSGVDVSSSSSLLNTLLLPRDLIPERAFPQRIVIGFLFLLYFVVLKKWEALEISPQRILGLTAGVGVLALAAYPCFNSLDMAAYLGFGRLALVYHLNPYSTHYSAALDQLSPFVWWRKPMPYGPLSLPFFMAAAYFLRFGVFAGLFAMRVTWLLVHASNGFLVATIVRRSGGDAWYGFFLYALNPLLVIEFLINGHNDVLMIFFVLLACLYAQRDRYELAAAAGLLAGLTKTPGMVLFLLACWVLVRRRAWTAFAGTLTFAAGVLLICRFTVLQTWEQALNLLNLHYPINTRSLYDLVLRIGGMAPREVITDPAFRPYRILIALLVLAFAWIHARRVRQFDGFTREATLILLALALAYSPVFWPWYFTWLVPLAACAADTRLQKAALALSATALLLTLCPYPWMQYSAWYRIPLGIVCVGMPLAYLASSGVDPWSWKNGRDNAPRQAQPV